MPQVPRQCNHADIVRHAAQCSGLMSHIRALRQHAFDARLPRLATLHHSEQHLGARRREQVFSPDVNQQLRHIVGRRRVLRILHLRAPRLHVLAIGNGIIQAVPHIAVPLRFRRHVLRARPVRDQQRRRPVHANARQPEIDHPGRHRFRTARLAQHQVRGRVIADHQHHLHQVLHGKRHAGMEHQLADLAAAGMQIGGAEIHHLAERELPLIHQRHQLNRHRHLEGAGHGKAFGAMHAHGASAFNMNRAHPDNSVRGVGNELDLPFEARQRGIGGGEQKRPGREQQSSEQ